MELSYDKAALQEYMDDIGSVGESLRRAKDESFSLYNSCKQQYTRLYTELEQANRKAYNMVESAESMQRAADAEYELAMRRLENAEDDSERESAQEQLRSAQARQAEAAHEMSIASAAYTKAQANMKKLTDVWERYQPSIDSAAHKVEDGLSSFSTLVSNGNSDLGEYMGIMDKAQAALYDGVMTSATSGGSTESNSHIESRNEQRASTYSFKSKKTGNMLGIVSAAGAASIIMRVAGKEQTFPYTKSGAAKAYRTAVKSGDDELASQTNLMFTSFGAKANPTMANQQYVADTLADLEEGLPETFDKEMVLAGAQVRKMRTPKTETSAGELKGTWQDSVFYMDDDFVPKYENDSNLTVGEIKQQLKETYGIHVDGIPFKDGVADFSGISVASISTKDIVMKSTGMSAFDYESMDPHERTEKLSEVFAAKRRNSNFTLADQIAAERQIPVPGLAPGYTASELAEWRSENKFSWDEQVNGGYNLVPAIIHGNISHTGLVSSSNKAMTYFKRRESDDPTKYSWDEEDAPISFSELRDKKK